MNNSAALHTTQSLSTSQPEKNAALQQILIDAHGFILESTDTIFSTFPQRHRPVMEWSPFLESIFPTLLTLNLHSPEIYFPRIQSITDKVFGLYDCSFMCVEWGGNQSVIVWNIIDNTADMIQIQKAQQRFNEICLRR
jgi:hypothetical protein